MCIKPAHETADIFHGGYFPESLFDWHLRKEDFVT
jgi:hypothetical protein